MSEINMKYTRLCKIPTPVINGVTYAGTSSCTRDDNTLYVLKSGGFGQEIRSIVIYRIDNYNKKAAYTQIRPTKKGKVVGREYEHPNAITFAKKPKAKIGYLFVATLNDANKVQVLMLDTKGEIKREILYKKNNTNTRIKSMDYIGVDKNNNFRFILGIGYENGKYKYDLATLKGKVLEYDGITLYSHKVSGTSNDIHYNIEKKKFYICFFKSDGNGNVIYNWIYTYNIDLNNITKGGQMVLKNTYRVDAKDPYTYFEIEGICTVGNTIYVTTNCRSNIKDYNKDAYFKLSRE